MSAIIAIVGRPNVGKSTLFNRILGRRIAIISKTAGTTRDRLIQNFDLNGLEAAIVDTGGLEHEKKTDIEANVQEQAKIAIQEANLIYFVVDATHELTRDDFLAADILRKSKKEIILVVNKCDNQNIEQLAFNFYELGFQEPISISAAHNIGIDRLLEISHKKLEKMGFSQNKAKKSFVDFSISLLGRPNVGKSSLLNAFCGKEQAIVSDKPGTTRDTIDTSIIFQKKKIKLVDTAGIRRRGRIEKGIEKFSILRCIDSIIHSDVCILMVNFEEGITKQDCHVVEYVQNEKKGLIIVVNKCDQMENPVEERQQILTDLKRKFSFIPWTSVVFISALEKKNIHKILELAMEIKAERDKRIPTPQFNNFLEEITHKHLPSGRALAPPKIYYGAQTGTNPPQFTLFMNDPEKLHFSYRRYITNEIRKKFGFMGTDIDLILKKRPRKEMIKEKKSKRKFSKKK